jgi:hypothetical protein
MSFLDPLLGAIAYVAEVTQRGRVYLMSYLKK